MASEVEGDEDPAQQDVCRWWWWCGLSIELRLSPLLLLTARSSCSSVLEDEAEEEAEGECGLPDMVY